MSFIKRVISDLRVMDPIYPLCGGCGLAVLGVITLMSCGCHPVYQWMLLPRAALPYWVFAILGILLFFLFGCAIGFIFSLPHCGNRVYKPMLGLLCGVVLTMVWYHVLFQSFSTFISIVILLAAMAIVMLSFVAISSFNAISAVMGVPICLIQLHLLWLNIGIRFLN